MVEFSPKDISRKMLEVAGRNMAEMYQAIQTLNVKVRRPPSSQNDQVMIIREPRWGWLGGFGYCFFKHNPKTYGVFWILDVLGL